MNRRDFLAALSGLLAAPKVLAAEIDPSRGPGATAVAAIVLAPPRVPYVYSYAQVWHRWSSVPEVETMTLGDWVDVTAHGDSFRHYLPGPLTMIVTLKSRDLTIRPFEWKAVFREVRGKAIGQPVALQCISLEYGSEKGLICEKAAPDFPHEEFKEASSK